MGAVLISGVPAPYSRNPDHKEIGDDMAAEISVIGASSPEAGIDGLKASISAFRKHHQEVGNALLNLSGIDTVTGAAADKDDPRPTYRHQAWPKMVYHADGRDLIVGNDAELKAAVGKSFREQPYPKAQVAVGDPAAEKKLLLDEIRERDGKLAIQNEMLMKLTERMEQMEKMAILRAENEKLSSKK